MEIDLKALTVTGGHIEAALILTTFLEFGDPMTFPNNYFVDELNTNGINKGVARLLELGLINITRKTSRKYIVDLNRENLDEAYRFWVFWNPDKELEWLEQNKESIKNKKYILNYSLKNSNSFLDTKLQSKKLNLVLGLLGNKTKNGVTGSNGNGELTSKEKDAIVERLQMVFTRETKIKPPELNNVTSIRAYRRLWYAALFDIYTTVGNDLTVAETYIITTISNMLSAKLTIPSPNSILNTFKFKYQRDQAEKHGEVEAW